MPPKLRESCKPAPATEGAPVELGKRKRTEVTYIEEQMTDVQWMKYIEDGVDPQKANEAAMEEVKDE